MRWRPPPSRKRRKGAPRRSASIRSCNSAGDERWSSDTRRPCEWDERHHAALATQRRERQSPGRSRGEGRRHVAQAPQRPLPAGARGGDGEIEAAGAGSPRERHARAEAVARALLAGDARVPLLERTVARDGVAARAPADEGHAARSAVLARRSHEEVGEAVAVEVAGGQRGPEAVA